MSQVEIVEVAARDGLQNEPNVLPTEIKMELLARCVAGGAKRGVVLTSLTSTKSMINAI